MEAANNTTELARHNGLGHISFIPTYEREEIGGLSASYEKALNSAWEQSEVSMDVAESWTKNETREDPGQGEGLVVLMKAGETSFKTLDNIAAYCRDYAVSVVGAVLMEG